MQVLLKTWNSCRGPRIRRSHQDDDVVGKANSAIRFVGFHKVLCGDLDRL